MKKQNGITLIALIITIIVMLILVAVTISIVLDGGIINKTQEAKISNDEAQIQEELTIAVAAVVCNHPGETLSQAIADELQTELKRADGAATVTLTNGTATVSYKGKNFTISSDWKVAKKDTPSVQTYEFVEVLATNPSDWIVEEDSTDTTKRIITGYTGSVVNVTVPNTIEIDGTKYRISKFGAGGPPILNPNSPVLFSGTLTIANSLEIGEGALNGMPLDDLTTINIGHNCKINSAFVFPMCRQVAKYQSLADSTKK